MPKISLHGGPTAEVPTGVNELPELPVSAEPTDARGVTDTSEEPASDTSDANASADGTSDTDINVDAAASPAEPATPKAGTTRRRYGIGANP